MHKFKIVMIVLLLNLMSMNATFAASDILSGQKWLFKSTANRDGILVHVLYDLSVQGVMKVVVSCETGDDFLSVKAETQYEIVKDEIINSAASGFEKKHSPFGFFCEAHIPVRKMKFKIVNEDQVIVTGDPMMPEEQVWRRVGAPPIGLKNVNLKVDRFEYELNGTPYFSQVLAMGSVIAISSHKVGLMFFDQTTEGGAIENVYNIDLKFKAGWGKLTKIDENTFMMTASTSVFLDSIAFIFSRPNKNSRFSLQQQFVGDFLEVLVLNSKNLLISYVNPTNSNKANEQYMKYDLAVRDSPIGEFSVKDTFLRRRDYSSRKIGDSRVAFIPKFSSHGLPAAFEILTVKNDKLLFQPFDEKWNSIVRISEGMYAVYAWGGGRAAEITLLKANEKGQFFEYEKLPGLFNSLLVLDEKTFVTMNVNARLSRSTACQFELKSYLLDDAKKVEIVNTKNQILGVCWVGPGTRYTTWIALNPNEIVAAVPWGFYHVNVDRKKSIENIAEHELPNDVINTRLPFDSRTYKISADSFLAINPMALGEFQWVVKNKKGVFEPIHADHWGNGYQNVHRITDNSILVEYKNYFKIVSYKRK